ncbi:hypothetical protein Lesp02_56840 [Lentzea sp. NBRC 105346]|uniref:hypothetical protein n=1 Tax=Lentzea sp. NBRC 105346 TaxID=3032205 RepID=UPI0024A0F91A|nr:hypothetical protein [Lentzea sp. NBRC 105346]GLZ33496.1 hypothetical protein Lesp02_56840 [Lentzea sp. NBRC 105346]
MVAELLAPQARRTGPADAAGASDHLRTWVLSQAQNVVRHREGLRPFRFDEFGDPATGPSKGHVKAVNDLLGTLRKPLGKVLAQLERAASEAVDEPSRARLTRLLELKSKAHDWVRATEQVWDFYLELFGQRQSAFAPWLVACDRIALDCYQYAYLGIGVTRSVPAPPPFAYMRTGFSPATYRRGIRLSKIGKQLNPFALIQLPYHRLLNPWTLGAILHEVSHNLQNDLGLQKTVPVTIARRLLDAGLPRSVAAVWTRWNREIFADMSGLLLGGPAAVGSLFDVVGRSRRQTLTYSPGGVHPTPYLRAFLSVELLRRMGFPLEAEAHLRTWRSLYPDTRGSDIPSELLKTARTAVPLVVDAVCGTKYPTLGGRTLLRVLRFQPKEQAMIEEAAGRLAEGVDPGVVPERFLIGAVRHAIERELAPPERLMHNFFAELGRRSR